MDGSGHYVSAVRPVARDPVVEELQDAPVAPGIDVRAVALADEFGGFQRWSNHTSYVAYPRRLPLRSPRTWLSGIGSVIVTDRDGDAEHVAARGSKDDPGPSDSFRLHRSDPAGGDTDMMTTLVRHQAILWFLALATMLGLPALAGVKVTATGSLTVQPAGPRQGEPGSRYFNVKGTKNDRYASFGVLVFELPKGGDQAGNVKSLNLRLVQSLARFSKDGNVRFFLAEPAGGGTDRLAGLKFELGSSGGVGKDAFRALHPLGSGTFKKVENGHADMFELKRDEGGQRYLRDRIKAGGPILIVAVPEDEEVAATYFGGGTDREENRPRLSMDFESAK
jgi:hypothetical protein